MARSPPQVVRSPPALSGLLNAAGGSELDRAWAEFVAAYTGIFLHTSRAVLRDRDAAMDGYTCVLESLHEDCCRRLRAYVPDPRTRFTTWLIIVVRRLVLDYHRRRYGRPRSEDRVRRAEHAARRRLEDFVAAGRDPDQLVASVARSPDSALRRRELADALHSALGELPPSDRLLVTLRFEHNRPVREIAAVLGLPTVFAVYHRLGAVLGTLRSGLARRGVADPEP
jgi:RNA polymerase sigma factor (sigma-70 family)